MTNWWEKQLPTFARASQNVAIVAALLNTLSAPSTDRVGKVYQQLKNILGTAAAQQAETSLQHRGGEPYTLHAAANNDQEEPKGVGGLLATC
jgi:hypothetical protein